MTETNKTLIVDAINTTLNYINSETKEIAVSNFTQNTELLDVVMSLPFRKIVVTNVDAGIIHDSYGTYDLEVFSCNKNPDKSEPGFFQKLCEKYNLNPQDCYYFDGKQANLDAASQVGIQ